MKKNQETVLDEGKTLSKSRLWQLQYAIYDYYGSEAWAKGGVPFYVTSNPYTARHYANMVAGYIRDCVRGIGDRLFNKEEPFYIFDLGAGTGRFGYLFLKELAKFLKTPPFCEIKVCYVMTDMIASNLESLSSHPYLQEMIGQGILDFAYYHTSYVNEPLTLQLGAKSLSFGSVINPAVVIGNYFFDVIPQDLFKVMDKQLCEGRLKIIYKGEIDPINPHPSLLKELRVDYSYFPVESSPYYLDETQEALLRFYARSYEDVPFTLPVAAFQTLNYFQGLSNGKMLLLAGDQGACNDAQIQEAGEPLVSIQGGISISVNYQAIAKYAQMRGGCAWLTTYPDPLFVVISAAFGGDLSLHPETSLAFENSFEYFQPSDYWKLTTCKDDELKSSSIEELLLLIKLGNWDFLSFHAFFLAIHSQLPTASKETRKMVEETIQNVWRHFFPVSPEEGLFVMDLGVLLFELGKKEEALIFFLRSLEIGGGNETLYRNISACYAALNKPALAFQYLLKSKKI